MHGLNFVSEIVNESYIISLGGKKRKIIADGGRNHELPKKAF